MVRIGVDLSAIMAEEENQNELVADVSSAFPLPVFLFRVLLFEVFGICYIGFHDLLVISFCLCMTMRMIIPEFKCQAVCILLEEF